MLKKLLKLIISMASYNCSKKGHQYKFKQAWEADNFPYIDKQGNPTAVLLATSNKPILDEEYLKDIINLAGDTPRSYRQRYVINLECSKCKHRISIEDTIFRSDLYT